MVTTYQLGVDKFWDIWKTFVLEQFFIIFSALWKYYCIQSNRFCSFIVIFVFKKPQFYAFNISNVKIVTSYLILEKVQKYVQ